MYIIICEIDDQSKFDTRNRALRACTGTMLREGMGREVGGGIGMGDTCTSMADSCQRMAKPLQYCKVISLQLKYIN